MQHNKYTKGITLIECMVAVTILAFAVAGPMTLAGSSLRASRDARDELIATHLAEEAIEVARSVRDNNSADDIAATHTLWVTTVNSNCVKNDGCIIDITARGVNVWDGGNTLILCPAAGDCSSVNMVYRNPQTGLYRQSLTPLTSPWQLTTFKRSLLAVPIDHPTAPTRQMRLIATVSYIGYGGKTRTVTVTDDIYNWFPPLR